MENYFHIQIQTYSKQILLPSVSWLTLMLSTLEKYPQTIQSQPIF